LALTGGASASVLTSTAVLGFSSVVVGLSLFSSVPSFLLFSSSEVFGVSELVDSVLVAVYSLLDSVVSSLVVVSFVVSSFGDSSLVTVSSFVVVSSLFVYYSYYVVFALLSLSSLCF
jgi:hypothetical protein